MADDFGSDSGSDEGSDDFIPSRKRSKSPENSVEELVPQKKRRQASPTSIHPLEPSIINVEPLDEFIREIADWIHRVTRQQGINPQHVEIEAKLGILIDPETGQRLRLPVLVETILSSERRVRFESNLSATQHKHFNSLLNRVLETTKAPSYKAARINYAHVRVVDSFYPPPEGGGDKIRVTRDEATKTVIECMRKIRLGDLNIYSPKRFADWRISINLEVPAPEPTGNPTHSRRKDRITYTHQAFNIDLTQVTPSPPGTLLHELEIEFAKPAEFMRVADHRGRNSPEQDAFDHLVCIFVNNCRIMVKNAISA